MTYLLARRVFDACHLTGQLRLRSGQVSEEYFDKYLFKGQPDLLRAVAEAMVMYPGLPGVAVVGFTRRTGVAAAASHTRRG